MFSVTEFASYGRYVVFFSLSLPLRPDRGRRAPSFLHRGCWRVLSDEQKSWCFKMSLILPLKQILWILGGLDLLLTTFCGVVLHTGSVLPPSLRRSKLRLFVLTKEDWIYLRLHGYILCKMCAEKAQFWIESNFEWGVRNVTEVLF